MSPRRAKRQQLRRPLQRRPKRQLLPWCLPQRRRLHRLPLLLPRQRRSRLDLLDARCERLTHFSRRCCFALNAAFPFSKSGSNTT
jgi:hypothetical protein